VQVVILCGGKGTRAYPYTEYLPKPMLPIHGTPILVHVMRIFAEQGHTEFILSVGYRKEVITDYFDRKSLDWDVRFVDTGEDTDTGGRIRKCADLVRDTFFATYADGLSDVSLKELTRFHEAHDGVATITSVPLLSQYGTLDVGDAGKVLAFKEKPTLRDHWINAGYFVFNKRVFDHWEGNNLEREVFPSLARKGLVYTYRHEGFFRSMDSYKDQQEIEQLVLQGNALWKELHNRSKV
jgi:glucose-1-phosphate cytidylyltransferase